MAHPPLQLPFQLTLDFRCLDKHHFKLIPSEIELCVDETPVFIQPLRETLFKEAKQSQLSFNMTIRLTCQIRYESTIAVYIRYKRKTSGEILRSDENSQKFWQLQTTIAAAVNDLSVSIQLNIRKLPVLIAHIALDREAATALLEAFNGLPSPNPDNLPTISNLQFVLRKIGAYRTYNERDATFAGLYLHALVLYLNKYPQNKEEYFRARKLVDMEGQALNIRNLRYNAEEDLLTHMHKVLDFSGHCQSIVSFPGFFSETFCEMIHYIALCSEVLCQFAPIYFSATYKSACIYHQNAMTLFRGCHEYLLYCRMRLTLGIKRRSAEIPDIPKPFRPPSVLMHVYPLARTELRIDPNWPIESFTAALIGIGGPIFDNIISKIRADIVSSQDDAHTRDMLRRLAAHIIQQAGVVPLDLLLFSGKLVLSKTGDANKQRKAMPVGEGSYASVYQGSYRSLRGSNQKQQKTDVEVFALKCMRFLSNHTAEDLRNQRQRMILELVNTWMLAHPYILSLKAVHFDPELSPFILVLPWMPNSNVRVRLQHYVDGRQAFTGKLHNLSNRWIGQIACGLEYVHTEGIVHGDVRGVNILVDQSDSIKIADFGLSLYAEGMSKNYASAREGNPAWTAPELFDRKTMQRLRGTREGDIYSFAMVCIELWTLTDPVIFPGEARPYRPNSPDPKCQEQMSDSLWRIVSNCWDEDPRKRFTALELRRELSAIGIAASP